MAKFNVSSVAFNLVPESFVQSACCNDRGNVLCIAKVDARCARDARIFSTIFGAGDRQKWRKIEVKKSGEPGRRGGRISVAAPRASNYETDRPMLAEPLRAFREKGARGCVQRVAVTGM